MTAPELRVRFADRAALLREFLTHLQHGRAFVQHAPGVAMLEDCTLMLVCDEDGAQLELQGQAVLVTNGDNSGVGVELRPFDAHVVAKLEAFVHSEPKSSSPCEPATALAADDDAGKDCESEPEAQQTSAADLQPGPARHERLRKLNQTQQQKAARSGDFNDRVLLERLFGRNVWEALLTNPKLTIPEVAKIARKGTVPKPLLELIIENATWIQAPIVRRALLGNPRTSSEAIMKLLRLTPKHELKIIHKTNTYSTQVREAARRALEG